MKQKSISNEIEIEGVGLHTGKMVKMRLLPADIDAGIVFIRKDLPEEPFIPADVKYVVSTNRGTTLRRGEVQVSTVEHILSALTGLEIDNVKIEIYGPEVPILDGSSALFVERLNASGIKEQDAEKDYFEIEETIEYFDEVSGTDLVALPADDYELKVMIDFNSSFLSQQYAEIKDIKDYAKEIASCRTFVFLHEIEKLADQGLIKGGDLDNAIVIADRLMDKDDLERLAKKIGKESVEIEHEGILNTTQLKFKNEPARHKLLDLIGDLSLVGKPIKGKIVATKPGHTANVEFAKILKKKLLEQRKLKGKPKYDPNQEAIMDTTEIMNLLPHRYPFLLVDKIIELSDNLVVGIKNISFNENYFMGHFPGNPVFPGVLQMEALAQTGGILALNAQGDPGNWDTYFLKMDNVKFKSKVGPGDTLILKMELIAPIRRGIVQMQGTAYVGNRIVSEGELTAQIVNRNSLNK
jgi:UDP-3-O-[3-hydroxymyristoyl] N-acetylglucosamine deacetylase/3-hydroxyacyl-[acyl-carrier-protein] dehydratase